MTNSGLIYQCSGGETYDSISLEVYGDEKYACELLNANPDLCTTLVFDGGEILLLPVVEVSENDGENDFMPAVAPWKEV